MSSPPDDPESRSELPIFDESFREDRELMRREMRIMLVVVVLMVIADVCVFCSA